MHARRRILISLVSRLIHGLSMVLVRSQVPKSTTPRRDFDSPIDSGVLYRRNRMCGKVCKIVCMMLSRVNGIIRAYLDLKPLRKADTNRTATKQSEREIVEKSQVSSSDSRIIKRRIRTLRKDRSVDCPLTIRLEKSLSEPFPTDTVKQMCNGARRDHMVGICSTCDNHEGCSALGNGHDPGFYRALTNVPYGVSSAFNSESAIFVASR